MQEVTGKTINSNAHTAHLMFAQHPLYCHDILDNHGRMKGSSWGTWIKAVANKTLELVHPEPHQFISSSSHWGSSQKGEDKEELVGQAARTLVIILWDFLTANHELARNWEARIRPAIIVYLIHIRWEKRYSTDFVDWQGACKSGHWLTELPSPRAWILCQCPHTLSLYGHFFLLLLLLLLLLHRME